MSNNNILHSISYFEFFKYRMRIVLQEWRRGTFPMVVWGGGGCSNCRNQSALVGKYWNTVSLRIISQGC